MVALDFPLWIPHLNYFWTHVRILSLLPPPHTMHEHRRTKYVLRLCAGKIVTELWPLWPVRNSCFKGTDCSYWTNGRQIWVRFTLAGFQRLLHAHKYSALTVGLYLNLNVAACVSSPLRAKWHVNMCRGSVDWFGPSPVFHLARPCFILTLKYLENSDSCPAKETPWCVRSIVTILWESPFSNDVAVGEQLPVRVQRMGHGCHRWAGTKCFAA